MATDPFVSFPFTAAGFPEGIRVHQNFDDILKYIRERNDGTVAWDVLKVTGTSTFTGIAQLGDGTVGAPALTFSASGQQDNGIYRIGTDNWGLAAGGVKVADLAAALVTFPIKTAIKGTATNDSAAAGFVGEIIESTASGVNYPATGNWGDLTSINLTAGDWLVSLIALAAAGTATVTQVQAGLSTTSGNNATGLTDGDTLARDQGPVSGTNGVTQTVPFKHVQLTATTTYYLKYMANYSVSTPSASGRITALRIR